MFKDSYKKTREERIELLYKANLISKENLDVLKNTKVLTNEIADKLIENQISIYGLPFGIATNFFINGKEYVVPMAIEEPSVIAAACNAAKIIGKYGGFKATIEERLVTGQISIYNLENKEIAKNKVLDLKEKLLKLANDSQPNIVKLGGGAREIDVEIKGEFLIVYLHVDSKDAMGANTVNTMLEVITPVITENIGGSKLMSIISNYSTKSIVLAECEIEIEEEIGKKIQKAIEFANVDKYRAVTNNKGIMNGIDAVVMATGNDWRAIEAGIHAYAVKNGEYRSLSSWEYRNNKLYGKLEIPLPIASFGGSVGISETSKISLEILKNPTAKELSMIVASVGLAQNFAALRALVTVGIQKGHMKLHLKSLAMYLGANENEIEKISMILQNEKHIDMDKVKKVLESMR